MINLSAKYSDITINQPYSVAYRLKVRYFDLEIKYTV